MPEYWNYLFLEWLPSRYIVYDNIKYSTVLNHNVQYFTILHYSILYNTMQCHTMLYNIILYYTIVSHNMLLNTHQESLTLPLTWSSGSSILCTTSMSCFKSISDIASVLSSSKMWRQTSHYYSNVRWYVFVRDMYLYI